MQLRLTEVEKEVLKAMDKGMYLYSLGNLEGVAYQQRRLKPSLTILKKGTIKRLLDYDLVYQSLSNPNKYLLTDAGREEALIEK